MKENTITVLVLFTTLILALGITILINYYIALAISNILKILFSIYVYAVTNLI